MVQGEKKGEAHGDGEGNSKQVPFKSWAEWERDRRKKISSIPPVPKLPMEHIKAEFFQTKVEDVQNSISDNGDKLSCTDTQSDSNSKKDHLLLEI